MNTSESKKQAIDAPRGTHFVIDSDDPRLVIIGRDTDHGPDHPRYETRAMAPPEPHIVSGMKKIGVKKPIQVQKSETPITLRTGQIIQDALIVIDGRQSVINAREATRQLKAEGIDVKIKVKVMPPEKGTDAAMLELSTVLNEHRRETTPLEKGKRVKQFLDYGYELGAIASIFGCSVQSVGHLSLLDLPTELQTGIVQGQLTASAGYALASASPADAKAAVQDVKKGRKPRAPATGPKARSVKEIRKVLENPKGLSPEFIRGLRFALGEIELTEFPKGTHEGKTARAIALLT